MIKRETILAFINKASDIMNENKDYLIELDAASGDGDLGLTMSKGFAAGKEAAEASTEEDLGKLLFQIGSAIAKAAPSTMGTLMASGFLKAAKAFKGQTELSVADFAKLAGEYYTGIQERGKANPGERTLLDSLKPAWDAIAASIEAGEADLHKVAELGYKAALEGVEATKEMVAMHGKTVVHRAKLHGVPDQGAIVGSLFYRAWAETL